MTLDKECVAEISYHGDSLAELEIYNIQNSDSITGKGLTLTVARNLVIEVMSLEGIDATDVMHAPDSNGGTYTAYEWFGYCLVSGVLLAVVMWCLGRKLRGRTFGKNV